MTQKTQKILFISAVILTALFGLYKAYALSAYDLRLTQRNATNTGNNAVDLPLPAGGASGIVGMNGTSTLPQYFLIGSGLSFDGTTLSAATASTTQVNSDWSATSGLAFILNKPSFATVATSGNYNDLSNLPTIPAAQINSDWNATSGLALILNKPTALSSFTNDTGYITTSGAPVQSVAGKTGVVTLVLSDITDTTSLGRALASATSTTIARALIGAGTSNFTPSGTSTQYIKGDGTYATFPTNVSSFTNDAGYLTGITSGQINTALGYTPYNGATNPNNYITTSGARSAISLTTTGTSGASTYNSSTGVLNIPNYAVTSGTVTSVNATSTDFTITGGPITTSGTLTANLNASGVATGTYANVTVNNKGIVTAGNNPSDTYPARSLNTCFQPSATRSTFVNYSVDINTQATLVSGQQGTVYLETFTDSGCTTGTQEVARFVNGSTVSLAVAITITQNVTGTLTGYVPVGKYVKLRTQNNTGTPTFTYRSGQEVLW